MINFPVFNTLRTPAQPNNQESQPLSFYLLAHACKNKWRFGPDLFLFIQDSLHRFFRFASPV